MNFCGSRLGFWFRPPITEGDRSVTKSSNVLIIYDGNSVKGQYGVDVDPSDIAASISTREISLGFTPRN